MDEYYIGIDGGGTKTALLAAHGDGSDTRCIQTTGASWREHGFAGVAALIEKAVNDMGCETISGIAAGMPCYGESAEGDAALRSALEATFPGVPLYLTNDVEAGWAGAFALSPGIHLVCGTGSIAYGCDDRGTKVRCGGWDDFFSDEGSAYWIARKGMELFSKQSDGRAQAGPLLGYFRKEFALADDIDFIDYVHKNFRESREGIASFQIRVKEAALLGDHGARAIYYEAAVELSLMANSIRHQLALPPSGWQVSYSGGVFKSGDLILKPLERLIEAEGGVLVEPKHTPVEGALLLALSKFSKQ